MFEKDYLSVSLGNKNIKLVCGHKKADDLILSGFSLVPTPLGAVRDGNILDKPALANIIENEIRKQNLKPKGIVFTISGTGVITRDIQLPRSTQTEVDKILKFDAEQFFPIDLTQYVFDYKIIENITALDKNLTKVMLAAVPEKFVDPYMELADLLGIPVEAVVIQPDCMYKLVANGHIAGQTAEQEGREATDMVVVDLGYASINVSIFSNHVLKFNRMLPYGLQELDAAIMERNKVDEITAERYRITTLDLASAEEAGDIGLAVLRVVEKTMQDISRLIDFYRSNNYAKGVSRMLLCGGGSSQKGLDIVSSQYFGTPVDIIGKTSPLANVHYKNDKNQKDFYANLNCFVSELGALIR